MPLLGSQPWLVRTLAWCSEERWDSALDMPKMPELKHWPPVLRLDMQTRDSLRLFEKFSARNTARGRPIFIQKQAEKTELQKPKCSYSSSSPQFKLLWFVHVFKDVKQKKIKNHYLNNSSRAWPKCPHSSVCVFSLLQAACPLPKLLLLRCAHLLLQMSHRIAQPLHMKCDFYGWQGYICTTSTFYCKNSWIRSCFVHCF